MTPTATRLRSSSTANNNGGGSCESFLSLTNRPMREEYKFIAGSRGILHVGASTGQERDIYGEAHLPVIWIEPIPEVFRQLREYVACYPDQVALNYLVTDEDDAEFDFKISSNGGQSSSIFEMLDHKKIWPGISYTNSLKLK